MIPARKRPPNDPNRGTGRTKRMVMSLPEGGCIVVAHNFIGHEHIKRMIGDLRGGDFLKSVRLVTLDRVESLRGLDLPIFVDHFVVEYAWDRHLRREYEMLLMLEQLSEIRRAK